MKVAIISDSHDHLEKLELFLNYAKKHGIKKIIHLGDACKKEYLEALSTNFSGDIFLIRGNADLYEPEEILKLKNITYLFELGEITLDKLKIAFVHEPEKIDKMIENKESFDFIFHGHTHKPWLKKLNKTIIANPGNLSDIRYSSSFAILETETKNLELKILNQVSI